MGEVTVTGWYIVKDEGHEIIEGPFENDHDAAERVMELDLDLDVAFINVATDG